MFTIIYDPTRNDLAVGDVEARVVANKIAIMVHAHTTDDHTTVSNELVIQAIRELLCKDIIDHDSIQFKYKDTIITVDELGDLSPWPIGFCDTYDDIVDQILDHQ